jgi:hypothetical protein
MFMTATVPNCTKKDYTSIYFPGITMFSTCAAKVQPGTGNTQGFYNSRVTGIKP